MGREKQTARLIAGGKAPRREEEAATEEEAVDWEAISEETIWRCWMEQLETMPISQTANTHNACTGFGKHATEEADAAEAPGAAAPPGGAAQHQAVQHPVVLQCRAPPRERPHARKRPAVRRSTMSVIVMIVTWSSLRAPEGLRPEVLSFYNCLDAGPVRRVRVGQTCELN